MFINSIFIDILAAYVDSIDTSSSCVDIIHKYKHIVGKLLNNCSFSVCNSRLNEYEVQGHFE